MMVKPNSLFCVGHLKSYKNVCVLNNKKTTQLKWEKDLHKYFSKEDKQIARRT